MTLSWTNLETHPSASLPVTLNRELIASAVERGRTKKAWVLVFVIGPKPS